jgi:O-acetyl-ADP-ribose deacetylase (regulator of RNase III)
MLRILKSGIAFELLSGDITTWRGDAIVNAANEQMLGGGGVDGAIHRAAGPELLAACTAVPELRPGVRCPTGEARITPAFGRLKSRFVIHTVGPIYAQRSASAALLRAAYRSSLELANKHSLRTIAFPAISCGVYGYPLAQAAPIALAACNEHSGQLESIAFVMFSPEAYTAWNETFSTGNY